MRRMRDCGPIDYLETDESEYSIGKFDVAKNLYCIFRFDL